MVGFFEIWGEQGNPGPVGHVDIETEHEAPRRPLWLVILKVFVSTILVALAFHYLALVFSWVLPGWKSLVLSAGILLVYVGVAFFLRPRPNLDNLGYVGGIIDDPFRYSDDLNRSLMALAALLIPGRFVAQTVVELGVAVGLIPEVTRADLDRQWEERLCREAGQGAEDWAWEEREPDDPRLAGSVRLDSQRYFPTEDRREL